MGVIIFEILLTANGKNAKPTKKLAVQLIETANEVAVGLAD